MDRLRRPFFFAAVGLIAVAVLLELGASAVLGRAEVSRKELERIVDQQLGKDAAPGERTALVDQLASPGKSGQPPGVGIPCLALLDGFVLFTVVLMGLPLLIPERVFGRVQGIATLAVSSAVLSLAVILFLVLIAKLILMITLLIAIPFGTLVYLALFGFFNRPGAAIALSLLMALKLGFAGCLVLAHQRFLQNKGLVVLVLTSLLAGVVVSFLHGVVPLLLVSITDAVAALIVVVLAGLWAGFLLIGAIIGSVKAIG